MNFVLASDNNYAPFLCVTITSLIEHNKSGLEPLYIYILNDNISDNNIKNILSLKTNQVNIKFVETKNLDNLDFSLLGIERNSNISLTAYARLFVASLLPEDVDKVIYLDCDTLVLGSFKELWDIDLEDNYAAAVLDISYTSAIESFGFKLDENYFNSGVLLINLKKWRDDNLEQKFIKFMNDNQFRFYQHDQGILNHVLKNKIAVIDPKFNLAGYFNILDYGLAMKFSAKRNSYYNEDIINNAFKDPVVLHFCGKDKPWLIENHPHRKLYEEYIEISGIDKNKILNNIEIPFMNKLFYKSFNNPLLKALLKLYPNFILYNQLIKNSNAKLMEENEKAFKSSKKQF